MSNKKTKSVLRQLRHINYSPDFIKDLKKYSLTQEIDEKTYPTYMKKYRFKKIAQHFHFDDDETQKLYAVINEKPKGYELVDMELPLHLLVAETEEEKKRIITQAYSDVKANGFSSTQKLYERISLEYLNISREEVKKVLNTLEVKQLQAGFSTSKVVKPIVSDKPMIQWEIDLIDMTQYEKSNEGFAFLFTIIDTHSKFAWVRPIKNKSAPIVAYSLQEIILQEGTPNIISCDNGSEFVNDKMKELCERFNIEMRYSLPYKPQSQGQIERFNATIKNKIYAYLADKNTRKYITDLNWFVYSYNTSKHSTTKHTPFQVHRGFDERIKMLHKQVKENISKQAEKMIEREVKEMNSQREPLNVGDKVRVANLAKRTQRKIIKEKLRLRNWSEKIYKVKESKLDEAGNEIFKLDDIAEEDDRYYFRYELMKIDEDKMIKKTGKKERLDYEAKYDFEEKMKEYSRDRKEQEEMNMSQEDLEEYIQERRDLTEKGKKTAYEGREMINPLVKSARKSEREKKKSSNYNSQEYEK